jgi:hypothetical protein
MITRNAVVVSVSVVLLLVSVALVLLSGTKGVENEPLGEEEVAIISLCSYEPTGDYILCCENELGEELDCTEKTTFEANEKITIIVNQDILKNTQAPYLLCEKSDLLNTPGIFRENEEKSREFVCIDVPPQNKNFVFRKEGFVPIESPRDTLTLLQLSVGQDDTSDSQSTLLTITGDIAQ